MVGIALTAICPLLMLKSIPPTYGTLWFFSLATAFCDALIYTKIEIYFVSALKKGLEGTHVALLLIPKLIG